MAAAGVSAGGSLNGGPAALGGNGLTGDPVSVVHQPGDEPRGEKCGPYTKQSGAPVEPDVGEMGGFLDGVRAEVGELAGLEIAPDELDRVRAQISRP
jgi:hypothetical protein